MSMSRKQPSKRLIVAEMHRNANPLAWRRHYNNFPNAAKRAMEELILLGQPGDVVVFSFAATGLEIGTMKVKTNAHIITDYSASMKSMNAFVAGYHLKE